MMSYSAALFENISYRLRKLDEDFKDVTWNREQNKRMEKEIKKIAEEHENVFRITRSMEELLNTAMLAIFFVDAAELTLIFFRYVTLGVSNQNSFSFLN